MTEDTSRPVGSDSRANLGDLAVLKMFGRPYRDARLTTWQFHGTNNEIARQREVLDGIQRLCDEMHDLIERGQNLLLYGPCGTGKDRLLVSLIRAALNATQDADQVIRWRGPDLWSRIRDGIATGEPESDVLRELRAPRVLAISDPMPPGLALNEFHQELIYRVLEHRHAAGRGTWMTINVEDRPGLDEALGVANASRICDGCIAICCNWQEFRKVETRL